MSNHKKNPAAPSRKLPPWECLNKRDAAKLTEWTNAKLDERQAIVDRFIHAGDHIPKIITDEQALEAAAHGDMTLLRTAYPEFAEYLRLPPRKRGRPSKPRHDDAVWEAVCDVKWIRDIWKKHFGKFKRPQNDNVSAEEIAADRWDVTKESVCNRLKKLSQTPL